MMVWVTQMKEMYLHFTMLLLKPVASRVALAIFCIYLHFTMLLLKLTPGSDLTNSIVGFTFHYASIKTKEWEKVFKAYKKFTFHYASIKTTTRLDCGLTIAHLHFTMLLLKL